MPVDQVHHAPDTCGDYTKNRGYDVREIDKVNVVLTIISRLTGAGGNAVDQRAPRPMQAAETQYRDAATPIILQEPLLRLL
jgi:hypothetical protein